MDDKFMKLAIKEANEGIENGHGGPFGCIIVKGNRIVGHGHNEVVSTNDPTAHGEIMAIRDACTNLDTFDLSGCELYTTGYPCPMCMCAIMWANIDKVYYGCNTSDTELIGFRDKQFEESIEVKKKSICNELMRSDCLDLYKKYAIMKDKVMY